MTIPTNIGLRSGLPATSAHLLWQVSFWWPKAKAVFNGRRFIAKSRDEWCKSTGLTPKQYRTALEDLKRRGLLRTEQHIWGAKAVTFLELTAGIRTVNGATQVGPKGLSQVGPSGHTQAGPNGPSLNKQKKQTEKTYRKGSSLRAEISEEGSLSELTGKIGKTSSEDKPVGQSVAQMAGLLRAKQQAKQDATKTLSVDPSDIDTPATLHKLWKNALGELGEFVGTMKGSDKGMYQHLCNACPPGAARVVLAAAVHHWSAVRALLESEYGAFKLPPKPHLGVIYKHIDAIVTWWRKERAAEAAPAPKNEALEALKGLVAQPQDAAPKLVSGDPGGIPADPEPTLEEKKFEQLVTLFGADWAKARWLQHNPVLPGKFAVSSATANCSRSDNKN